MTVPYSISGFVLAGGKSSRMGEDKALLPLGRENLLTTSLALMRPLCEAVGVIGPREKYRTMNLGAEVVEDIVEPCGPLGGILTALHHAKHDYALVLACDLPLMTSKFLHYLISAALAERPDAVVPVDGTGDYQPLCALYAQSCAAEIEAAITRRQFKVSEFFPSLKKLRVVGTGEVRRFSPDFHIFYNVNTPEEFAAVKREMEGKSRDSA